MTEELNVVAEAPATETAAPVTETPAEKSSDFDMDAVLSEAWDKANAEPQPRGPDGKFVSTKEPEAVEEAVEAAPAETEPEEADTTPETGEVKPETPAIDPPVSWSAEMKEKWATLPSDVQQYVAGMERDARSHISRLGQQVKAFEPIAKTLEQHRATFERNGMSFVEGVQALLNAQAMLDENPRVAIRQLAAAYGEDLGATANDETLPSRELLALQARFAELERQNAELRNAVQPLQKRFEENDSATVQAEIADWSKDKPYFNEVRSEMAALATVVEQQNPGLTPRQILDKTYTLALAANDAVRSKIEAERKSKAAAEAKAKAEAARKVASLNVKSNTAARPVARSIEDDLSAAWDRLHQAS